MRPEALAAAQWWADRLALGPGRHDMGDPRINAIMNRDVPEVPYTPEQLTAFRGALAEGIDREIGAAYGRPITIRFDYQPDWVLSDAAQRAGIDLEPDGLPLLPVKTYTRVAPDWCRWQRATPSTSASPWLSGRPTRPGQPSAGRDRTGTPSSESTGSYELICPACGDDGGPYQRQPSELQELRGPYPSVRAARRALREHQGQPKLK